MWDAREPQMLGIQEQIRQIVFSSMLIGSFPEEWSYEAYNKYLKDGDLALRCCALYFGGERLGEEKRQELSAALKAFQPGLCLKVCDSHAVCLLCNRGEKSAELMEKLCHEAGVFLGGKRPELYSGEELSDAALLIPSYLRIKKQILALDFPDKERDEEVMGLFALEEELFERVSAGDDENLLPLLIPIAQCVSESQRIFLTDEKEAFSVVKSYYSFLWREIVRQVYRRTGKRKTQPEHISIDLELNTARSTAELTELIYRFILSVMAELHLSEHSSSHRIVEEIKSYISSHCKEDISLVGVAEELGLSSYYISRLFKKEAGCNFRDYLIAARMEKAMALVREGRLNVNEIALEVGYLNPAYFSSAFHRYFGVTAKECLTRNIPTAKQ